MKCFFVKRRRFEGDVIIEAIGVSLINNQVCSQQITVKFDHSTISPVNRACGRLSGS